MNGDVVFVDTNILLYAHDLDAGKKHETARKLVTSLWQSDPSPAISIQVLQELYTALVKRKVPAAQSHELVHLYLKWNVVPNDRRILTLGLDLRERLRLSPWDAWIVAAAHVAGAGELLSEDFNPGQEYAGVVARNPLE